MLKPYIFCFLGNIQIFRFDIESVPFIGNAGTKWDNLGFRKVTTFNLKFHIISIFLKMIYFHSPNTSWSDKVICV
jgi:hypothetical protein